MVLGRRHLDVSLSFPGRRLSLLVLPRARHRQSSHITDAFASMYYQHSRSRVWAASECRAIQVFNGDFSCPNSVPTLPVTAPFTIKITSYSLFLTHPWRPCLRSLAVTASCWKLPCHEHDNINSPHCCNIIIRKIWAKILVTGSVRLITPTLNLIAFQQV